MTYTVLVYKELPDEATGYWAQVPELPGCMTRGETIDEIRANIVDAIETWLGAVEAAGDEPLPVADARFEVEIAPRVTNAQAEA